jgi:predicted dehydrogenase
MIDNHFIPDRKPIGVGIIGCGLVGRKRALALGSARLVACASRRFEHAEALANSFPGAVAFSDWRDVLNLETVDVVIVATSNDLLAEITMAAVEKRKHVLVEKPAARSSREIESMIQAAENTGVCVRVGFNHRYHPAFLAARKLFNSGALGELMFVRGRYGHGGRVGYDQEWRSNPTLSGGGVLLDLGVHMIDLARWFLGDFAEIQGFTPNYFWPAPVEDNGFMLLRTACQQVAFLHVSCTEWKNLFSLEIYGRDAKLHIEGLGGSYGTERLAYYKMLPQMGPPETTIWEYPGNDRSWEVECLEFLEDIRLMRTPSAGLKEAYAALRIIETVYKENGNKYQKFGPGER